MNYLKIDRFICLIFLVISFGFLGSIVAGSTNSPSQTATGFVASKVLLDMNLSDGQTEPFWSNITVYQEISEFGTDGYVKFANNGTHLFALFVTTLDNEWISIEFEPEPEECMTNLNDGWVIYIIQNSNEIIARDIKFIGTVRPETDTQKDIMAESIFSGGFVYVEIIRPFDTNDTAGNDITFSNGSLNMIQFASETEHVGVRQDYYIFMSDQIVAGVVGTNSSQEIVDPGDIYIPTNIPSSFNVNQLKFILLGLTPVGVFAFMIVHTVRRVYSKPIENENLRVVDKSFKAPTFMERFRETFLEKN